MRKALKRGLIKIFGGYLVLMYFVSWVLDFLFLAIIIAVLDESFKWEIEKHQAVGAFLVLFIPTVLEIYYYLTYSRPFMFGMAY